MTLTNKKIGSFSDIHLGLAQDSKTWHQINLDFAKWSADRFRKEKITDIFIPGDIFHNRSEISLETLTIAKQFFDHFKDFNIIISTGNHDCFLKSDSQINSVALFDGWSNITVVDTEPLVLATTFDKKIAFVPWGYDIKNLEKVDTIFGHFAIMSFFLNSYKQCDHGLTHDDLFAKCDYVVSGHFHKRDHRTYDKGEIVYLGSPYQQNFGATLEENGIYIFDLEANTFEFIENEISPRHFRLHVSSLKAGKFSDEYLETVINQNFVSLVVDDQIDHEELLSLNNKLVSRHPLAFRVDYMDDMEKAPEQTEEKEYKGSNVIQDIEDYVKTLDIEYKDEVVEYLKDSYNSLVI